MRIRKKKGEFKNSCSKCGKMLEPNRAGKQRYCRSCHRDNMKAYRAKKQDK